MDPASSAEPSAPDQHAFQPERTRCRTAPALWEPWEHPANIPLHLPSASVQAPDEARGHIEMEQPQTSLAECHHIMATAGPLFIEGVAAIGQQLVGSSCVGHLEDPVALSALVLAQSLYAVTGYSLVSGLASALETLCGQAYGAGNLPLMTATLLRAQLVCSLAIVPTLLLWGSGLLSQLLPAWGQEAAIAGPSTRMLQFMAPALVMSVLSETVAQYMLAQGKALPIMISSLVGLALAPLLYWGLVFWFGYGLIGAALAAVSIQSSLVVLLVGYLIISECWPSSRHHASTGWKDFSPLEALQGWWGYLQYGLPAVLMVCLEWWMWEVIVFLAGLLPDAETAVAVTGLSTQIQTLPWMLCFSIGTATATRVAQALGAGDAVRAARLFRLSCLLVLACSAGMCGVMWVGKGYMAAALTGSKVIQQQLKGILPVVVATIILDGQAAVLSGVMRGAGRQGIGAATSWCSYWLVGLPLAWLLAFKIKLGVLGLRLSLAVAVAVQALVLHILVACRLDWQEEVVRAKLLVGADAGDNHDGVLCLDEGRGQGLTSFCDPDGPQRLVDGTARHRSSAEDATVLLQEPLLSPRQSQEVRQAAAV